MPYAYDNYDDFDLRISAEEYYERDYSLVSCDNCGERVSTRNVHYMESFLYPDTGVIVCSRCYKQLLGPKENKNGSC